MRKQFASSIQWHQVNITFQKRRSHRPQGWDQIKTKTPQGTLNPAAPFPASRAHHILKWSQADLGNPVFWLCCWWSTWPLSGAGSRYCLYLPGTYVYCHPHVPERVAWQEVRSQKQWLAPLSHSFFVIIYMTDGSPSHPTRKESDGALWHYVMDL